MTYFACGLIDCIVGMSAERYFAFKNMHTKRQSKAPIIIFACFSGSSFVYLCLATIAVCFESVRDALVLTENEAATFLVKHLEGSLSSINPASILIFRPDIPAKSFAIGFAIFVSFVFSRYFAALIFLVLNATKTSISTSQMSDKIKKNNKMLLRCIYAQFFGFCTFAGFPAFAIVATFYFLSKPNSIISFCFLLMNCFGLYDILVTVIFIKPYRSFFVKIFEYLTYKYSRCRTKINPNINSKSIVPVGKIFDATSFALK
uniref:G protein-coupled receptor n=1 Tax=Panagrolaimus sp. PS1159 TaxID=55785 RepID=A0AC35G2J9_9BILA